EDGGRLDRVADGEVVGRGVLPAHLAREVLEGGQRVPAQLGQYGVHAISVAQQGTVPVPASVTEWSRRTRSWRARPADRLHTSIPPGALAPDPQLTCRQALPAARVPPVAMSGTAERIPGRRPTVLYQPFARHEEPHGQVRPSTCGRRIDA